MTLYNVHIYREMRLLYGRIEAANPDAAALKARDLDTDDADSLHDCDGKTFAALVDVVGDEDYAQSRLIEFPTERSRDAQDAAALLLDMIRIGVLSLEDGQAEFQDTVYAFDDQAPDWKALVDAIGCEIAAAPIEAAAGRMNPGHPFWYDRCLVRPGTRLSRRQ